MKKKVDRGEFYPYINGRYVNPYESKYIPYEPKHIPYESKHMDPTIRKKKSVERWRDEHKQRNNSNINRQG